MLRASFGLFLSLVLTSTVFAHCQVPCGIYGDQLRFEQLLEDEQTIAKAQLQINELVGKTNGQDANQLARWVLTKEEHAASIQETVTSYFLAQRIKADSPEYVAQLKAAHLVTTAAMKCKQSNDAATAKDLEEAIFNLYRAYEGKEPAFQPLTLEQQVDVFFGKYLVQPLATIFFWKVPVLGMPLVVAWLLAGSIFFTLRMKFVNIRMFWHAIELVRGKYDNPNAAGEVSHFQALATALSATVGLGNIAGVAIAVSTGGPGATLWMIMAGLLGMSAKFTEVTLGQQFRQIRPDGSIMGGAMYYLSDGLAARGLAGLGRVLAIAFVILCIGGSLGGGNSFQVRLGLDQVRTIVPFFDSYPWAYGIMMAALVGIVIIGGIRRIASVADKIVPAMCVLYVLACIYILFTNITVIPSACSSIIMGAFNPQAAAGGFLGCLVIGIRRAAFSNEAGVGSAAIAHSAARSEYPVQEGIVSLLEPFIDTVVVCTMTALVIVITGVCHDERYAEFVANQQGAALTSAAMADQISWFPYVLAVAIFLFSFSTMISWSYYGERCWTWLFGESLTILYRLMFLCFTFLGSVVTATNILDFSDLMILGMAFPNILGVLFLTGIVAKGLSEYQKKLANGEVRPNGT